MTGEGERPLGNVTYQQMTAYVSQALDAIRKELPKIAEDAARAKPIEMLSGQIEAFVPTHMPKHMEAFFKQYAPAELLGVIQANPNIINAAFAAYLQSDEAKQLLAQYRPAEAQPEAPASAKRPSEVFEKLAQDALDAQGPKKVGEYLKTLLQDYPFLTDPEGYITKKVQEKVEADGYGEADESTIRKVVGDVLQEKAKETQAFLLKNEFTDEQKRLNQRFERYAKLAQELLGEPAEEGQSRIAKPGSLPYLIGDLKRKFEQEISTPVDTALNDIRNKEIRPLKNLDDKARSAPRKAIAAGVLFGLLFGAGGYFGARYAEYKLDIKTIPSAEVSRKDLNEAENRLGSRIGESEKAYADRLAKIEAFLAGGKADAEKYAQNLKETKESLGKLESAFGELSKKGDASAKEAQDMLKILNQKVDEDAKRFLEYTLKAGKDDKEKSAKAEEERKARESREKDVSVSISDIKKMLEKYAANDTKFDSMLSDLTAKYASLETSAKAYDSRIKDATDAIKALKAEASRPAAQPVQPGQPAQPAAKPAEPQKPRSKLIEEKWAQYKKLSSEGKSDEASKVLDEILKLGEQK